MTRAVDDQIDRGIILKDLARTKRGERPVPQKIQPELQAASTWALLAGEHNAVDIEIGTGRSGYSVAWGFNVWFQLPTRRRGTGVQFTGDRLACKADENGERA